MFDVTVDDIIAVDTIKQIRTAFPAWESGFLFS